MQILLPPLRTPMAELAATQSASDEQELSRQYLTCCVRLSPEKEPERFVTLVENLAGKGSLQKLKVILKF